MAGKKTGDCIGPCGRKDIVIIGRGLCSKCYYHARKKEKAGPLKQEKTCQEIVNIFIKESCLVGDCEIILLDLYAAYKKWWCENPKNEKKKPLTHVRFFKVLTLVDFKTEKKGGKTYIQGISLVVEEPIQETVGIGDGHTEATTEEMGATDHGGLDKIPFDPESSPLLFGERVVNVCRECGCTELDCSVCIEKTGQPCYWVEPDLCSACVPNWIPCDMNGEILEAYNMGMYTLAPGEQVLALEETERALLEDLTTLGLDNVASVTKILRVGGHEIERTTVYKNESLGPSGLQRYLPAIVAPIVISTLILIYPEYWRYCVFGAIEFGALLAILTSHNKKG